jgi:hypothetical protein
MRASSHEPTSVETAGENDEGNRSSPLWWLWARLLDQVVSLLEGLHRSGRICDLGDYEISPATLSPCPRSKIEGFGEHVCHPMNIGKGRQEIISRRSPLDARKLRGHAGLF